MDLLQIKYIIAITECGSMTQAAQQLHISQSALSLSCKRLEEELGTKLFRRVGRKLELTDAGTYFCEKGQQILQLTSELQEHMLNLNKISTLTVTYTSEVGDFSTEAQKLYLSFFPDRQLAELRDNTQVTLDNLRLGIASFALTCSDYTDDEFESLFLYEEPMYAFVKNDSPLAEYDLLHMSQLEGLPFITQRHDYSIAAVMTGFFSATGVTYGKRYYVSDPESMFLSVHGGFGVAFIPESIVNLSKLAPIDLYPETRMIPMAEDVCLRKIYLTTLRSSQTSEADTHFMDFLRHYSALMQKVRNIPNPMQVEEYASKNWPGFNCAHASGPKPDYKNMLKPDLPPPDRLEAETHIRIERTP